MIATKTCSQCGGTKPVAEFCRKHDRYGASCKRCNAARTARYRIVGSTGARIKDDGGGMSHAEIALELGISRTLVQQIEAKALQKLRAVLCQGFR